MEKLRYAAKEAYDTVNNALQAHFNSARGKDRLEIEIPPSSLIPEGLEMCIQKDGNCFAIPKRLLAMAFVHARDKFFRLHDRTPSKSFREVEEMKQLSFIMLLYDSEIITATNFRIGLLNELRGESAKCTETMAELRLLDSLLTSPLPRHTKSPNLWSYRYWLLSKVSVGPRRSQPSYWIAQVLEYRQLTPGYGKSKITLAGCELFLRAELKLLHEAGERHPKNYYAFVYARQLVEFLLSLVPRIPPFDLEDTDCRDEAKLHEQGSTGLILIGNMHRHHEWCLQHPSDCSGWSFLGFLVARVAPSYGSTISLDIITETTRRIVNLAWSGAGVWTFIKTTIAHDGTLREKERKRLVRRIQAISRDSKSPASGPSGKALEKAASEALVWIKANWQGRSGWPCELELHDVPQHQGH